MEEITVSGSGKSLLSAEAFKRLSEVPPEVEWFADIQNRFAESHQRQSKLKADIAARNIGLLKWS